MRRSKKIYILLGVLATACIATFAVMRYEEYREKIRNSEEIILEVSGDSVKAVSWEYESETLSFRREEEWLYEEDETFPVDEEKIGAMLEQFESFGASFIIEEVEDYGQYGLDEPICTIRLETEDESYEISLGNFSEMDSQRYVSIGDGNAYLVKEDPLEQFDVELSDLIRHDEIPQFEKTETIQFAGTENYSVTYEEGSADTYCADDVYFTEDESGKKALDTSLVESYLNDMNGLGLRDYVTYHASEEELASYGLNAPELTIMVDYSYEDEEGEEMSDTFVLHVSRDPEERQTDQETEDESGEDSEEEEITAYARVGESQIIYQISGGEYKDLMAVSYNDLRHREVLTADFADMTQIDVSLDGTVYTFTSEEKGDEQLWYYQEEEVEISELKTAFAWLEADSFTEEEPTQKEEISLTVYLDNENYPQVLIELFRYDGDSCLAVVDGEPVSLVERSAAVDLIEAVHGIVLN